MFIALTLAVALIALAIGLRFAVPPSRHRSGGQLNRRARMHGLHRILLRKIRGRLEACFANGQLLFRGLIAPLPTARGLMAACGEFFSVSARPFAGVAAAALIVTLLLATGSSTAGAAPSMAIAGITASADVPKLMADLQKAFNDFREANDERWKALDEKKSVDPLLENKVNAANQAITALQKELAEAREQLREVENNNARATIAGSKSDTRELEVMNSRRFFSLVRGKEVESVTDDEITQYRNYRKALNLYFRKGNQAYADPQISAALTTGAAPSGGFWLTPDSSGRIVEFLEDLSSLRKMATVSPIGTDTYEGFYDLDEAGSGGWVGETTTRSETDTPRTDGKYSFPIFEQYANPKASQKMLDDSENDVESWLAKKVAGRMAKYENAAFVSGNGITRPKGFTTYAAGTPARTSVDAYRVIRQINSGAAATFASSNPGDKFIDMIQALPSALRGGARWAMTSLTLAAVRKFKDGQGNYLFIPDFSANSSLGSLLGHGIDELSDMAELGAGNLVVAFANWKEAYEIKDHVVGTRVLRDPYTGKPYVSFYTTKRVGGDVVNFQGIVLMKCST